MRQLAFIALLQFCFAFSFGQNTWKQIYSRSKVFIENKGQFDEFQNSKIGKIFYTADFGQSKVFFGENGVSYSFLEAKKIPRSEREKLAASITRVKVEDHKQWESVVGKFHFKSDEVNMIWENGQTKKIEAIDAVSDYSSYSFKNETGIMQNVNHVKGFKKIIYKEVYPKIDIEFTIHPQEGLKYAVIVKPGANPENVKMLYDRDVKLENGVVRIPTLFGDIIDNEPFTFYQNNNKEIIKSSFIQHGKVIQFKLDNYDHSKTLVIDPWTQTPSFATNWDCVWECERDGAGNVYIMGGVMPMQIVKYNSSGTLQWTYNTPYDTSNVWLGTFATDLNGNSYVTAGSVAKILKLDNAGTVIWNNTTPFSGLSSEEFWSISFNCDQTQLVVGGTSGSGLSPTLRAAAHKINTSTGAVISTQNYAIGPMTSFPPGIQEIRAICASPNGKYYFLTQDTVGAFSQNVNLCGTNNNLMYKIPNTYSLGYKCENFRYDDSGICAIKANNSFFYTQNGSNVHKRSLSNGTILATAIIPGGAATTSLGDYSVSNSGIDIDDCGNVYVGSSTGVVKYDANLTQIATYSTSFKVYDVHVNLSGDIIACGSTGTSSSTTRSGYVQTFAASACSPLASNCCDATICPVTSLCVTASPVTLTAATSGGTWSGPGMSSNGSFNPATAGVGTHTITYTLPCGSESTTIVVSPCQTLTACIESNGSITVSNGVAPYTWSYYQSASSTPITTQAQCTSCGYTWFFGQCLNGATPATSCNTPAQWVNFATGTNATAPNGVTQVQVTDNSSTVTTFTIASLAQCNTTPCPTITVTNTAHTDVSCFGGNNGSATVSASGGTSPYTYAWSPGNLTGATQSALTAGTYTVTATDNATCTGTVTITIAQPSAALTGSSSGIVSATCGSNNGSATVIASGGTSPYSYSWSPGGVTGSTVSNMAGGNYVVTITDAYSCSQTVNVNIPTAGGPVVSLVSIINPNCNVSNSGSIIVSGTGGNAGYNVSWSGPSTGNPIGTEITSSGGSYTLSNLSSGTYIITVTDANNCSNSVDTNLIAPTPINLTQGTIVSADCGSSNGSASVLVANGSGNYSYSWSPSGGNAATANSLTSGNYSVTVTDALSGCTSNLAFVVPSVGGPVIDSTVEVDVICNGASNGSITVYALGGTAPYQFAVNSGTFQSSNVLSNLSAGQYQVTVSDATNCFATLTVNIQQPSQLTANAGIDATICIGQTTNLTATASGGTGPYIYSWSVGGSNQNIAVSPTSNSTYTLTLTDANGCSVTDNVLVNVLPLPNAVGDPVTTSGYYPLTVNFTNASSNANSYVWDFGNGQTQSTTSTASINSTYNTTGTYTVTLTASNGLCQDVWNGEVIVFPIGALTVEFPNVFSPNNDGSNDFYGIITQNAASQEAIIVDRWGILMVELNSPNATWDGKSKGKEVLEGVYFLKYRIVGLDGTEQEGHTFFHLVR